MVRQNSLVMYPPTLTVPCSSIDHRSLIVRSNLDRKLLHLILAFHSLRLRLNSWTLSVTILLIYAFPFLVVQLLWWWLSSTCSSWKFLSYNLSIWLPLPVGEPWHAVDAAKIHPDCSRAHNSLNLRFSYLNIKTFSAYKWKFLSHRNTGPLRQLDLISSSSFPRHLPEPWSAGIFLALMYRECVHKFRVWLKSSVRLERKMFTEAQANTAKLNLLVLFFDNFRVDWVIPVAKKYVWTLTEAQFKI